MVSSRVACLAPLSQVTTAVRPVASGGRKKITKKTGLRTLAFMACIDSIATRASMASRPHMVEQIQA